MEKIIFTDVGEGLHDGEILQWFVKKGDTVKRDEALVEIQTDKVAIEVTATKAGYVASTFGDVGDRIIVGDVLVELKTDDQPEEKMPEQNISPIKEEHIETQKPILKQAEERSMAVHNRVKAAPSVRKLANQLQVDLQQVSGTGPKYRITKEDVRNHMNVIPKNDSKQTETVIKEENKPAEYREKIVGVRKQMYQNIAIAQSTIPHTTAMYEINVTELIHLRTDLNKYVENPMTYLPIFVKIVDLVLKEYPIFNARIDEEKEEIVYQNSTNLGIAMATKQGLIVPVLKEVQTQTLEEIAVNLQQLTTAGKTNKLTFDQLKGATFSISSTGMKGGIYATPVMTPPQVAILSLHAMVEKPVILKDRTIGIGTVMGASLSFDHRIIDGEAVGLFMDAFQSYIENPNKLLLKL